jgi:hypothetical protein
MPVQFLVGSESGFRDQSVPRGRTYLFRERMPVFDVGGKIRVRRHGILQLLEKERREFPARYGRGDAGRKYDKKASYYSDYPISEVKISPRRFFYVYPFFAQISTSVIISANRVQITETSGRLRMFLISR